MMEGVSGFSGHWLEILAAVYLVGMVLYGHYRGFIRLCVSALALVISLVTVRVALPYVTEWLKNDTPVYESIRQGMADAVGLDGLLDGVLDIGEGTGGNGAGIGERRTIEELKLPEQMKRILIENNNREVYQMLGMERFGDYVGGYLADTVIKAAASILLFAVVFILLHIVAAWLDLIARLPIIKGLNQIAGAVLGGVEGLMFLWIVCLVLTALSGTDFGTAAMGQVAASPWLSWLYDHNVISYFILGLVKGML